jgi:hypothetical protein
LIRASSIEVSILRKQLFNRDDADRSCLSLSMSGALVRSQ